MYQNFLGVPKKAAKLRFRTTTLKHSHHHLSPAHKGVHSSFVCLIAVLMDHAPELAPPDEESQLHHRRFVRVKTLSSKEYALNDLEDTDNIFRIKEMLEEREGEAVSNQVLVGQNGDPLHDVCSLSELPEGETTLLLYLHRY